MPSYMAPLIPNQIGLDMTFMYSAPQQTSIYYEDASQHPQPSQHFHHKMGREMDDMMADSGFNRPWDMFNGSFKPL